MTSGRSKDMGLPPFGQREVDKAKGFRTRVLILHRILGGMALAYFGLVFVTGTLLVFGLELQSIGSAQMRALPAANPASFGTRLDAAAKAHPKAEPRILSVPPSRFLAAPVEMRIEGQEIVIWTEPSTGIVQGVTQQYGLKEKLRRIHANLGVDNRLTLIAVTSVSVVLLGQLLLGLVSQRRVWRVYTRKPVSGVTSRMRTGTLHRWAAMWALPMLLVTGLTALFYFVEALGFSPDLPPANPASERAEVLPDDFDGASLDRAVAVAQDALPGLHIVEIYLPVRHSEGIRIRGDLDAWLVRPRANEVTVDPVTFEVLGKHRGEDLAASRRLTEAADPLHYGVWGGLAIRVIWLLGGLLSIAIVVSATLVLRHRVADGTVETGFWHHQLPRITRWLSALAIAGAIVVAFAT